MKERNSSSMDTSELLDRFRQRKQRYTMERSQLLQELSQSKERYKTAEERIVKVHLNHQLLMQLTQQKEKYKVKIRLLTDQALPKLNDKIVACDRLESSFVDRRNIFQKLNISSQAVVRKGNARSLTPLKHEYREVDPTALSIFRQQVPKFDPEDKVAGSRPLFFKKGQNVYDIEHFKKMKDKTKMYSELKRKYAEMRRFDISKQRECDVELTIHNRVNRAKSPKQSLSPKYPEELASKDRVLEDIKRLVSLRLSKQTNAVAEPSEQPSGQMHSHLQPRIHSALPQKAKARRETLVKERVEMAHLDTVMEPHERKVNESQQNEEHQTAKKQLKDKVGFLGEKFGGQRLTAQAKEKGKGVEQEEESLVEEIIENEGVSKSNSLGALEGEEDF